MIDQEEFEAVDEGGEAEPLWVPPAPPVKKVAAPPPPPLATKENPVAAATRLAMDMVAKRYQEDMESRENRRGEGALRMSPTDQARISLNPYFPIQPDLSEMVDENGKSLVKPGWVPRWVAIKDSQGRATNRRLRQFYLMGAEDVMKRDEHGKMVPLVDELGKAIQIPPQAYAAWVLHKSSSGAFDSSPYVKNAMELAEEINKRTGRNAVSVRPMAEHGQTREEPGPYGS